MSTKVSPSEEISPVWIQIAAALPLKNKTVAALCREVRISRAAFYKGVKARGLIVSGDRPPECKPERAARAEPRSAVSPVIEEAAASSSELVKRGRAIILALMAELESISANIDYLEELIEEDTAGDRSPKRRQVLMKAVGHATRATSAKNLASALRTLADAAPGKKAQADADADTAAKGSDWDGDIDSESAARPN